MRRQIITSFIIIFALFTLGAGFLLYNLLTTTSNLRHLIGLHEIEDIRQHLNLSVQKVQGYVNASGTELSNNLDQIIANIEKVGSSINRCHECHHESSVQAEIEYTGHLANEFEERLLEAHSDFHRSIRSWNETLPAGPGDRASPGKAHTRSPRQT